jgi:replicative DNA helicase
LSDETYRDRVPPHDIRAEAAVLGAILLDNEAINRLVTSTRPEHFYREANRTIYRSMLELAQAERPIDPVTLSESLKGAGALEKVGGGAYLVQLLNETPAASNAEHYARIVRDKAMVRAVIDVARQAVDEGFRDPPDVDAFVEQTQARVFDLASSALKSDVATMREVIAEAFRYIEKLLERKERVTGVPTGFVDLDDKLSGLQPSDLVILAARPSMGKTALALNILANAALKGSVPCVIFSLEMAAQQLALRMLCSHARVNSALLRTGMVSDADWSKLIKAVGALSEAKIFVDETPALSLLEMRARARRLKQEHDLGFIAVDYLQLMRGSDLSARRGREQEISEISRGLKALAKELQVPVLALSQLNRGVESRTDKRPMMSDLRESGAIEQDADVVMFLYRDDYYNPETEKPGITEVIIGKQRNGPTGTVELKFTGKYTRFDNFAKDELGAPPAAVVGGMAANDSPF